MFIFFNLFNYNLRITTRSFETPANGTEFASRISQAQFPAGISASLQFAK